MEAHPSKSGRSLTLILVDWQNYEERRTIMRSQSQVHSFGWIPHVEFADSRYTDAKASGDDVASLIRQSDSELIAIVDDGFVPEKHLLTWLADFNCNSEVHTIYHRNRANNRVTNFILQICSLLTKLLLRVGKTRFKPGMAVFKRDQELIDWVAGTDDFDMTRLLALARLHGRKIHEAELSPRQPPTEPIKTRHVNREMADCIRFWWNRIMFPNTSAVSNVLKPDDGTGLRLTRAMGWATLIAATLAVLSFNLGFPLFEPDEARNAQLAMNILQSGEWNTLTLAGERYWDKPPLLAWATAMSMSWFGVSEISARLPGNLAAILTVLFTLGLGQRLLGFRAALISGFLLLASGTFVFSSRFVTMDAGLTMCTTLALLAGYLAVFRQPHSLVWWILAAVAMGTGMLIKGPVIVVLCLPPLIAASWLTGNRTLLQPRMWIWLTMVMLLIAGPWYLATALVHPEFVGYFFWTHHVVRYADGLNHSQPIWFYIPVILVGMFPASLLIPTMIRNVTTRRHDCRLTRPVEVGFLLLSAAWIIGFFSLSQSKLPTYILPACPLICLMAGWVVDSVVFGRESRLPHWLKVAPVRAGGLIIGLIVLIQLVLLFWFGETRGALVFTVVLPAILLLVWRMSSRIDAMPGVAWSGLAMIAIAFSVYAVDRLAPEVAETRSIQLAAHELRSRPEFEDSKVIFFGREDYGASVRLPKPDLVSFETAEMNAMCEYLYEHPTSIIVSSDKVIENLRVALDWHIELSKIAGNRHLYVSRQSNIRSARLTQIERQKAARESRRSLVK
jgi:dolichol-phosphate mannosyltransferase